jgi:hypothetical protein
MAKRKGRPIGETIGGILVGFDHQVFRATKPTPELVESAKPIAPVPAAGGGTLRVELPGLGPVAAGPAEAAATARPPEPSASEDDPAT